MEYSFWNQTNEDKAEWLDDIENRDSYYPFALTLPPEVT